MVDDPRARAILDYWFGTSSDPLANRKLWFGGGEAVDAEIRQRFADDVAAVAAGEHAHGSDDPQTTLAAIIAIDQFTRNLYRNDGRAWEHDPLAQQLTLELLRSGRDVQLTPVQRWFAYMPLMHAEDRALQDESVQRFAELAETAPEGPVRDALSGALDYARRHAAVIYLFGRYPHRNERLGRESSEAERLFLKVPGVAFG